MNLPARILVVEDEARIAEVIEGYLEAQGHGMDRAATGEEALDIAARRRPVLVLLDLGLPACRESTSAGASAPNPMCRSSC
jgi:DNA-binding response OmpR family regulator